MNSSARLSWGKAIAVAKLLPSSEQKRLWFRAALLARSGLWADVELRLELRSGSFRPHSGRWKGTKVYPVPKPFPIQFVLHFIDWFSVRLAIGFFFHVPKKPIIGAAPLYLRVVRRTPLKFNMKIVKCKVKGPLFPIMFCLSDGSCCQKGKTLVVAAMPRHCCHWLPHIFHMESLLRSRIISTNVQSKNTSCIHGWHGLVSFDSSVSKHSSALRMAQCFRDNAGMQLNGQGKTIVAIVCKLKSFTWDVTGFASVNQPSWHCTNQHNMQPVWTHWFIHLDLGSQKTNTVKSSQFRKRQRHRNRKHIYIYCIYIYITLFSIFFTTLRPIAAAGAGVCGEGWPGEKRFKGKDKRRRGEEGGWRRNEEVVKMVERLEKWRSGGYGGRRKRRRRGGAASSCCMGRIARPGRCGRFVFIQ